MRNRRLFTFILTNTFLDLQSLNNIIKKDENLKQNKDIFIINILTNVNINNKYINKPLRNYKIK